ncbi:KICSTOR subunit 2-like [Halichondria panicea]|uniref:KICSTOR subunit 2-like n=1 Tax=Halichondria panicea TaxID=6063 RepID=UPI00312BC423
MATTIRSRSNSEGGHIRSPPKPKPSSSRVPVTPSGSEFVNIGSPEENLLETYFVLLSKFSFDRAKEQCDREREIKSGTGGTNWCELMSLMSRLCVAEMNYFSLSFMERAATFRLVRREPLKAMYDSMILDLKRIHEVYMNRRGGSDFSWERKMTELVTSLLEYTAAKRDMTDFYVHFEVTNSCHLDYKQFERYLKDMLERYKDSFQHPYLRPVKTTFQRELTVLGDLLQAQISISEWQFLPAILALQAVDSKLSQWKGLVPLGSQGNPERRQVQKSIRSPPQSPPPSGGVPYLYKWLCKFHVTLLAKFTLYFHDVLSEHASVYDMKHLSAKLDVDFLGWLSSLIRHTPVTAVMFVFNSTGVPDFKGPRYRFPDSPAPTLTGLNSYPFMITIPHDFEVYHHRANIISMIIEKGGQLNSTTQPVSQHDDNLHCVYYLTQVEPLITMVCIATIKRRERDNRVTTHITDIAAQLRNIHIATLLRPS